MITAVVDPLLEPAAAAIGFPVDRIKFVGCILLSYPLGLLFKRIPTAAGRHLWSILVGLFMVLICFDVVGLFHFLAGPLVVFALMNLVPSKYAPRIGFIVMLGYLSALHIYRMITDWMGYSMDVTSLVMVSVIKVTAFSYNYRDGKLLSTPLLLTPYWQKYAVATMPTLFEFVSYLFYFPTFLAGPAFHFSTYKQFIEGTLYVDEKYNPSGKEPSPFYAATESFGVAIVCLVIHVVCSIYFPIGPIYISGGLDHINIIFRLVYLLIAGLGVRCQYYFAWKLSEGAGILSGLGFNGYNSQGKPMFDRLCNIFILKVEAAGSVRDLTIFWNYATGEWLKNYVYMRQAESVQAKVPTWAMYVTNTVSAFWHGFYPGYYFAFISASYCIDIFRQLRTRFRPLVVVTGEDGKEKSGNYPRKHIYDFVGWALQAASFNFGLAMFVGLSFGNSWVFWQNFWFLPVFGPFLVHAVLFIFPAKSQRPKKKPE